MIFKFSSSTIVLLLIIAGFRVAQDVNATPTPISTLSASIAGSSQPCGFLGDNNTYGLGIRLAIYLQWLTLMIAGGFVPEEAVNMRQVNNFFTLSNLIALLYTTFTRGLNQPSGEFYAVEGWIVLSLCIGGISAGKNKASGFTLKPAGYADYKATVIGTLIKLVVICGTVYYAVWYLYVGMDRTVYTACSTSAFYFAKVNIFHWFRTVMKVMFTIAAVVTSFGILYTAFHIVSAIIKRQNVSILEILNLKWFEDKDSAIKSAPGSSLNLSFVVFIITTELAIRWNHIKGVNSISGTGQILPLVIAGANFVRVIWKYIVYALKENAGYVDDEEVNLSQLLSALKMSLKSKLATQNPVNPSGSEIELQEIPSTAHPNSSCTANDGTNGEEQPEAATATRLDSANSSTDNPSSGNEARAPNAIDLTSSPNEVTPAGVQQGTAETSPPSDTPNAVEQGLPAEATAIAIHSNLPADNSPGGERPDASTAGPSGSSNETPSSPVPAPPTPVKELKEEPLLSSAATVDHAKVPRDNLPKVAGQEASDLADATPSSTEGFSRKAKDISAIADPASTASAGSNVITSQHTRNTTRPDIGLPGAAGSNEEGQQVSSIENSTRSPHQLSGDNGGQQEPNAGSLDPSSSIESPSKANPLVQSTPTPPGPVLSKGSNEFSDTIIPESSSINPVAVATTSPKALEEASALDSSLITVPRVVTPQ